MQNTVSLEPENTTLSPGNSSIMRLFVFVLFLAVSVLNADEGPEVEIGDGGLRGKYMKTRRGRRFSAFLGIPYAKPPLGELRFKAPVENEVWEGVRDASKDSDVCYQRNPYTRSEAIEGTEDCLYLNVYTPQLPSFGSDPLPVMVWFHGGGWVCGAGTSFWYGPDILLDRDVVLVVPNFRLGPLGFLSTGDDASPGNVGLKDQVAVLRWVQKNIEKFGGDKNKVTAFGESAGGASVEFHMMSPISKGLFHRGISQSGTAMCNWALAPPGQATRNAKKLAAALDCPTECSQAMVDCLRTKNARDIIAQDKLFNVWDYDPMIPFKPVVEHEHPGAFLSKHPQRAIEDGDLAPIPWVTGITASEGALRVAGIYAGEGMLEQLDSEFSRLAPISLGYDEWAQDPKALTDKIRKFYFGKESLKNVPMDKVVDLYTDAWFLSAVDESIRLHLKHTKAPTYLYYFAHRGVASFSQVFGDPSRNYGVCHADDLQYLFPVGDFLFPEQPPDECDKNVAEIVTSLWASFANTGEPTAETNELTSTVWEAVKSGALEYLHIGNDTDVRMEGGLLPERATFWASLPTRPGKPTHTSSRDEL